VTKSLRLPSPCPQVELPKTVFESSEFDQLVEYL